MSIEAQRQRARDLAAGGHDALALKLLYKLVKQEPELPELWADIGERCQGLRREAHAVRAFTKASSLYANRGQLVPAIRLAKVITEIDPEHQDTQRHLAELAKQANAFRGELDTELDDLETVSLDDQAPAVPRERDEIAPAPEKDESRGAMDEPAHPGAADVAGPLDEEDEITLIAELSDVELDDGVDEAEVLEEIADEEIFWPEMTVESDEILMEVTQVPIFSHLDAEAFFDVIGEIRRVRFFPDETVIKEGERGDAFYVIAMGGARVVKQTPEGNEVTLAELGEGDFFGEFAFLTGTPRTATVVANDHTELLEFSAAALQTLVDRHPAVGDVLEKFYRRRLIGGAMRVSPIFRALPAERREAIIKHFESKAIPDGTVILKEGKPTDALYIIVGGEVVVEALSSQGRMTKLATLGPGSFFGEMGLLSGKPAVATCTARGDVRVFRVPEPVFRKLIGRFPEVKEIVVEAAKARASANRALLAAAGAL